MFRSARWTAAAAACLFASLDAAACRHAVVAVHGNTGNPSDFDNTYVELRARGYAAGRTFRPNRGRKTCAACNNRNRSEETPVLNARLNAIAASCTGPHRRAWPLDGGATVAGKQIADHGLRPYLHTSLASPAGVAACGPVAPTLGTFASAAAAPGPFGQQPVPRNL